MNAREERAANNVPRQDLQTFRSEDEERPQEGIMPQPLADQCDETVGTFAEVDGGGGDQLLHTGENRNHVAASVPEWNPNGRGVDHGFNPTV
jgi:hypothetical protein